MFQFSMLKKVMTEKQKNEVNRNSIPQLETNKSKKEIPNQELSPKTKKLQEHKMKRNQSTDNFMKFSWSWTL